MALAVGAFRCAHLPLSSRALSVTSPRSIYQFDRSDRVVIPPAISRGRASISETFTKLKEQGKVGGRLHVWVIRGACLLSIDSIRKTPETVQDKE